MSLRDGGSDSDITVTISTAGGFELGTIKITSQQQLEYLINANVSAPTQTVTLEQLEQERDAYIQNK